MTTRTLSSLLACAGVQALALTAAQMWDVSDEVRTNRLFVEARLPQAECATLDEHKGSGPDRGHMRCPVDHIPTFSLTSEDALGRPTQFACPGSAASVRA
jgi:DNA/RNA endonuclease G (NUC1)